jgi:hypothetical protein
VSKARDTAQNKTGDPTGVYELDPSLPTNLLDASGRIDWMRAIHETLQEPAEPAGGAKRAAAPPSRPAPPPAAPVSAPATSPPAPAPASPLPEQKPSSPATPENKLTWEGLPGADKVLRPKPASHGHHARGKGHATHPKPAAAQGDATPSPVASDRSAPSDSSSLPSAGGREGLEDKRSRYERLKREPSMKMDPQAVQMANEFADILFHINRAMEKITEFRKRYPYMIAPNVFACWEGNLKESLTTMYREFQTMKDPQSKNYDRRYVCRVCKSVFFVSLPEGLCDECRGRHGSSAH